MSNKVLLRGFKMEPAPGAEQVWPVKFFPVDRESYPNSYTIHSAATQQAGYDFVDTVDDRSDLTIHNQKTRQDVDIRMIAGSWKVSDTPSYSSFNKNQE